MFAKIGLMMAFLLFVFFFFLESLSPALAACPTGFTCSGIGNIINSTGNIPAAPSSSDKVPYVEGSTTYNIPGPTILAGPSVANTAALRLACTAFGGSCPAGAPFFPNGVIRLTDGAAGSPPLYYSTGSGACSTDNGISCVNSADGNRWNAVFPSTGIDPRWAGCIGNGTTDDTSCMQTVWNVASAMNGTVVLGPRRYAINSAGLTCSTGHITVEGTQVMAPSVNNGSTLSGFIALTPNTAKLINNTCNGSSFRNFGITMGTIGQATSGIAFFVNSSTTTIDDVSIGFPCIGLDISGNSDQVYRLWVQTPLGSSCGGMRIGSQTTAGNTVDLKVSYSTLVDAGSTLSTAAGFGMLVEDAGGMYVMNNDILYFVNGTVFKPGVNQQIPWFIGVNTVLGDTTAGGSPVVFDTSDATGVIKGWHCTNCWVSNAASPGTFGYTPSPNILIQNTANGIVSGIHFDALRAYGAEAYGVLMNLGVSDISVDSSQLCGAGVGGTSAIFSAVAFGSGGTGTISGVRMHNDNMSASCDGVVASGKMEYAVIFANAVSTGVEMTGDKMYGGTAGEPVFGKPVWSGVGGVNPTNIFKDNPMIDDLQNNQTVTSNAISPGVYNNLTILGTNTVSTINDCWPGREIKIRTVGATTFATGGNIEGFNTATPAANTVTKFFCSGNGVWYGEN